MHDIVNSKKMDEGVIVVWNEGGLIKDRLFTYQDLIDMKINAADLVDRPMLYKIDMVLNTYVLKR
jgi:hypothetical protein